MIADVVIEPMTEELLLWRCLHHGPVSPDTIDQWPSTGEVPWERYRQRNLALLRKLMRTYGACAIVARDRERIVGHLRFYPKVLYALEGAGHLCLLQDYPSGPADDFAHAEFPAPAQVEDRTISVHCLMTGSPQCQENPYQRKGIGTRMVRTLIDWARANGWRRIEADSFEDLPVIYEITGSAGRVFWEKLGFHLAGRYPHPALQEPSDFVTTLEEQAKSVGIPPERARDQLVMRLDLA